MIRLFLHFDVQYHQHTIHNFLAFSVALIGFFWKCTRSHMLQNKMGKQSNNEENVQNKPISWPFWHGYYGVSIGPIQNVKMVWMAIFVPFSECKTKKWYWLCKLILIETFVETSLCMIICILWSAELVYYMFGSYVLTLIKNY